jgi:NAD(P)-dependent dehydrogenase (short-subunit alcohol dehydrogenase family)
MTTVALFGAAGKIGTRIANRLREEEAWDKALDVDAKGVFPCSQAAIRHMIPRRPGRIANFASIAGMIVRTGQIAYCAAKAAAIHFSRCLAVEMAPHGITVNCLCPGRPIPRC